MAFHTSVRAASDNILSGNIKEADGTTGQNTNTGAGVKTNHIQNGAVTDAKILGPISASKIEKPEDIVTVAISGGDYTSIQDALDAINPSAENPFLIRVMPGTYTSFTVLKDYVRIQGAGRNVTTVTLDPSAACTVNFDMVNNVEVSGFSFLGGGPDNTHPVVCQSASNVLFEDNVLADAYYGLAQVRAGTIRGNIIRNVRVGIQTDYGTSQITDNTISCATGIPSIGIQVYYLASSQILRNIVTGCASDIWTDATNTSNISFNVYDTRNYLGGPGGAFNVRANGSSW